MRMTGRHEDFRGVDFGPGMSPASARRAAGTHQLRGRHLELSNFNPSHPDWRQRQARKLWALLKRNALHPSAVADVKRRYAREFAAFARAEAKAQAAA